MEYNKETLGKVIKDVKRLNLDSEEIFITGSLALCVYGLADKFNDVDLVAVDDAQLREDQFPIYSDGNEDIEWNMDERIGNDNRPIGYDDAIYVKTKNFLFNLLEDDFIKYNEPMIKLDYNIFLHPLKDALRAKAYCNRKKDKESFVDIIERVNKWCKIDKL